MAAHEGKKTAYPNSFRVNLEDKQSQALDGASEATGKPKSTLVREAIWSYCRGILIKAKEKKKLE